MDTIFAQATPIGRGGVSVIRLSGPDARQIGEALAGPLPKPRHAYFRALRDGELLDHALVLRFSQGESFTGEDVCELHLHGAPVIATRVEAALLRLGARRAEAGEFTKRAFLNGRMDLVEAEGLADLLSAETEAQRKQAMRTASGEFSRQIEVWRNGLVQAGALIEASIDFADEELPDDLINSALARLAEVQASVSDAAQGYGAAERIREGFVVAIVGAPNVGKSTLINRLAQRDIAIVSDKAGTTRDVLEFRADLSGLAVTFLDTAGIRETSDEIETIGVERAIRRASDADMRIFLIESDAESNQLWQDGDLYVVNKSDLGRDGGDITISAKSGQGVGELVALVTERLSDRISGASMVSHERQAEALKNAAAFLEIDAGAPVEMIAEQVRRSVLALERLIGRIDAEDYLDVIFSSFCIGK